MNIKKHIPNFLTCCNLICGVIGIIFCFKYPTIEEYLINLGFASILIFVACVFDFLDGFIARILKVSSPIGKELDSLADCVTFGVLPGIILFRLIYHGIYPMVEEPENSVAEFLLVYREPISMLALIIPVFSALRLAKFNIDTRQSESFIGVPTPANAILVASIPLILINSENSVINSMIGHPYVLIGYSIIMSYLLIAELPLFALKFKNFGWQDNKMKYILLISALFLFVFFQWAAIPMIIFLYILLSLVDNKLKKISLQKQKH